MNNAQVLTLPEAIKSAEAVIDSGDYVKALNLYSQIIEQRPGHKKALFKRAQLYSKLYKHEKSIKDLKQLLAIDKNGPRYLALKLLAVELVEIRQYDEAIVACNEALKLKPDYGDAYHTLVDLMLYKNAPKKAREVILEAQKHIQLDANLMTLMAKISSIEKNYAEASEWCEKALDATPHPSLQAIILGRYANAQDKLGNFDKAIQITKQAQELIKQLSSTEYTKPELIDNKIDKLYEYTEKHNFTTWSTTHNESKNSPIFLVGFPRSGTTLMEQMLHSHERLLVTDELGILNQTLSQMKRFLNKTIKYPNDLEHITEDDILNFQNGYNLITSEMVNLGDNMRIVDKNPLTFIDLLLVQRFFPHAPVIMMIRDPRDVILSCFFQTFTPNSSNAHFYSLEDSAKYYAHSMSLYLKYREKLNLNILEVRYESLCNAPEHNLKKVLEHINEEWDETILSDFSKKQRFIRTPSNSAVRGKVTKKNMQKWKNYEKYFTDVLPILRPFLKEFGYE